MSTHVHTPSPRRLAAALAAAIALVLALALRAGPAVAATTTLTPVADAYVDASTPGATFGADAQLRADGSPVVRADVLFDARSVTGTITRATVRFWANSAHSSGHAVRGVSDTGWGERTITHANAPAMAAPPAGSSGRFPADTWTQADVTALVTKPGLVAIALTTASSGAMSLAGREAAASRRPQLVIETSGSGGGDPGDPGGAHPVIAAAGDIACDPANPNFRDGAGTSGNCRERYTSDLLVGGGYAAVLALGDSQNFCGSLAAYEASYDRSWGRVLSIARPVAGNHDHLDHGQAGTPSTGCDSSNAGARGYFTYFGSRAGPAGKGRYSYDVGTWHVIALNSNCSDVGGCGPSSPQGRWPAEDLAGNRAQCTLAYWHIPLFSSGGRAASNARPFWDRLYAAGAEVVPNGHDHMDERFAPQTPAGEPDPEGIREFIVNTGGQNHTSIEAVARNSQVRNDRTYGVLSLTLRPGGYDWRFVPEAGAGFTDSGSGACR